MKSAEDISTGETMIDLERLANLINNRGIMSKTFSDMSKEDILYICKSVISCQIPGYITNHKELRPCYLHGFWYVYETACKDCNNKECCPSWTE